MHSSPSTRNSLLMRLRDPDDQESWETFHAIYREVIYCIALRHGLSHDDSQDVTQNVLLKLHHAISEHDPTLGPARFRTWLFTITRHAAIDFLRRKRPDQGSGRTTIAIQLDQTPGNNPRQTDDDWTEKQLEHEYRLQVFRHVSQQVHSEFSAKAWNSFAMTFLDGHTVKHVAKTLRCSPGSIYASRARVLRRMRELVLSIDCDLEPCE